MTLSPHPRRRLSTTAREALYDRCRGAAEFPTCNICGQLVLVGDAWDESHDPEGPPRCFGGAETGVAHRACNRRHGAGVVRPLDAKATRKSTSGRSRPAISCLVGGWTGGSARSTAAWLRGTEWSMCVTGKDKVASLGRLVARRTALERRLIRNFAVVELSESPTVGRGVFDRILDHELNPLLRRPGHEGLGTAKCFVVLLRRDKIPS
jgi:hypothetical protein